MSVPLNSVFNPMDGVTATDLEDGDLTAQIQIIENDLDVNTPGIYSITYTVTDSQGVHWTVTRRVTVSSTKVATLNVETEEKPVTKRTRKPRTKKAE